PPAMSSTLSLFSRTPIRSTLRRLSFSLPGRRSPPICFFTRFLPYICSLRFPCDPPRSLHLTSGPTRLCHEPCRPRKTSTPRLWSAELTSNNSSLLLPRPLAISKCRALSPARSHFNLVFDRATDSTSTQLLNRSFPPT